MKTAIEYFDYYTGEKTDCGVPLEIEISSRHLDWKGVLLEKGWSPYFHPKNTITNSFYFALALDSPLHWHAKNEEELLMLKTDPGEVWINPPRTAFTHEINETCFFIILLVEENEMLQIFDGNLPSQPLNFLNQYNVQDNTIMNIINLFLEEVKSNGSNGKHYFEMLKKLLSNYFIKNYSNYKDILNQTESVKIKPEDIEIIKSYIISNMSLEISIDTLAFQLNMSKFYFLKEFKKATGITPYQYIIKIKLEVAKKLLQKTQKSLVEIALELGFSDQSHFTRTFTKQVGTSPGVFKSNFLQIKTN
jgi:AraC family transcriptional regulator